eukprot:m51a1_g4424 putative trna 2 -phosphotransferase 1 (253) ;mRNA; f:56412-57170
MSAPQRTTEQPRGAPRRARGPGGRAGEESAEVRVSKALSYLLRHGAQKEGLAMRPDGFALVADVLAAPSVARTGCTAQQLRSVVAGNDKQRFALQTIDGREYVRANQGHSLAVADLELRRLDAGSLPAAVVHGTYERHWASIRAQGLRRMGRTHVHMAKGLPGADGGVVSGMRASCDVLVFVDAARAVAEGLALWESANGVVLAEEVPAAYFKHVVRRGTLMPFDPEFPAPLPPDLLALCQHQQQQQQTARV